MKADGSWVCSGAHLSVARGGRIFMVKIFIFSIFIVLLPSLGITAETVAKVSYRGTTFSVISEGRPWEKSCKLIFQVKDGQSKKELNIKRQEHGCLMLGPVQLYVSASTDSPITIIYLESDRGDDSGSTGPIVETFQLSNNSLKKLGEYELYDALFQRHNQKITSVTGNALVSLCETCEYPVSLNEDENFFVPVTMKVAQRGLSVKTTLKLNERSQLLSKFDAEVKKISEDPESASFPEFANRKRKKLEGLLNQ
jgi:hypothetical protein